jgi:hypothetical protein
VSDAELASQVLRFSRHHTQVVREAGINENEVKQHNGSYYHSTTVVINFDDETKNRACAKIAEKFNVDWCDFSQQDQKDQDLIVLVAGFTFEKKTHTGSQKVRIMVFKEDDLKVCKRWLEDKEQLCQEGRVGKDVDKLTEQFAANLAKENISNEELEKQVKQEYTRLVQVNRLCNSANCSYGKRKSRWDNAVELFVKLWLDEEGTPKRETKEVTITESETGDSRKVELKSPDLGGLFHIALPAKSVEKTFNPSVAVQTTLESDGSSVAVQTTLEPDGFQTPVKANRTLE